MVLAIASKKVTNVPLVKSVPHVSLAKHDNIVTPETVQSTKSKDNPLQTGAVDYYARLPLFDDLVASFQGLKDWEIDQTLAEVDHQLTIEDLVNRANEKRLDEPGYQRLATLIQKSDALYHIKMMRKVDDIEKSLAQTK